MRGFHILKPNEGNEHHRRMVFLDSESRVDAERVHHPYLAVASFYSDRSDKQPSRRVQPYWSEDERFPDLWDAVTHFARKGKTYIVAHNMWYDLAVLRGVPELARRGWTLDNYFSRGPVFVMEWLHEAYTNEKGKLVSATGKRLYAYSSTNYYAAPLAKLGEIFGIPKLSVDYNADDRDTILEYCKQDVYILETAVLAFQRFVLDNDLGVQARTLAGQAFAAFRHRFMTHEIGIHSNVAVCDLERRSYTGGRVECWRVGTLPARQTYYKLDFNSMYPAVMHDERYPTRLIQDGDGLDEQTYHYYRDQRRYAITAEVDVDVPEPVFPKIANGHLIYPTGSFRTVLSTPEMDYGYAHGYIRKVHQYAVYETAPIFKDYVAWFYERKMNEPDEVLRNFYKLFLNSLYGKFGQRVHGITRVGDAPIDVAEIETVLDYHTGETHTYRTFGGTRFEITDLPSGECEAYNSFPAIAAHVTAYARMKLWTAILVAGRENVYYMDTDSMFTNRVGMERLQAAGWLDPARLGALKVEGETDILKLRQPKDYTFGESVKRKGVGKNAVQVDVDTWRDEQWPRLEGMVQRGAVGGYQNRVIEKHLSRFYRKGEVSPDGVVLPLRFENDRFIHIQRRNKQTNTINELYNR